MARMATFRIACKVNGEKGVGEEWAADLGYFIASSQMLEIRIWARH